MILRITQDFTRVFELFFFFTKNNYLQDEFFSDENPSTLNVWLGPNTCLMLIIFGLTSFSKKRFSGDCINYSDFSFL